MSGSSPTSWRAFAARFVIATVVAFLLTSASIGAAYWYGAKKFGEVVGIDLGRVLAPEVDPAQPANYLIVGSDSRAFVTSQAEADAFGSAAEFAGGQRSDTIIVAHVDPGSNSAMLLSFPRDLWVDIPGRGSAKINAAFNDGPEGVIQTIQSNFDIPIHHYLEVDFAGFEGIVNAMGSIDIYFPTPARDSYTGLSIKKPGCRALEGTAALAYVRSRHYQYYDKEQDTWHEDGRADIGRIARQQYFLRSLAQTAIDKGARNPFTAKALLDRTVPNLKRDQGLGFSDVLALVSAFQKLDPGKVPMQTVPYTSGREEGQSVLYVDDAKAAPLFEAMRSFTAVEGGGGQTPKTEPPTLAPSEVTVQVRNGSGVANVAGDTLGALEAVGFVGAGTGNADRYDYETTEIRYPAGHEDAARAVQYYVHGVGTLVEDAAVSGADVELVVGRDFAGVADPSAPATSTTSAAPTTTTTTTTVPIAPGDPSQYGLPAMTGADGAPLVGCPAGT